MAKSSKAKESECVSKIGKERGLAIMATFPKTHWRASKMLYNNCKAL
jgi:hypothetical protein